MVNSTRSNKPVSLLHKIHVKEDQSELCVYMYTFFNQLVRFTPVSKVSVTIKAVLVLFKTKHTLYWTVDKRSY